VRYAALPFEDTANTSEVVELVQSLGERPVRSARCGGGNHAQAHVRQDGPAALEISPAQQVERQRSCSAAR
jgi:hypothetical protein